MIGTVFAIFIYILQGLLGSIPGFEKIERHAQRRIGENGDRVIAVFGSITGRIVAYLITHRPRPCSRSEYLG